MGQISFDVLKDPWIPVLYSDGNSEQVGIEKCIEDAHAIKTISDDPPYEKVAILRLLIAFLCDMYKLKGRKEREMLYDSGKFDRTLLNQYILDCVENGSSFDLFDEKHPFMTFTYNPKYDNEESRLSAVYLHLHLPHGDNPVHVVAQREEDFEGDGPAEFLRSLLTFYLYPTGNMMKGANIKTGTLCYQKEVGKDGKPVYEAQYGSMGVNAGTSMAGEEPVFFWPEGKNLFQTLVLCMKSEAETGNLSLCDPPVPWKTEKTPVCERTKRGDPVPKVSYVSALTFQSRRVIPVVENGKIKECYINNGYVNADEDLWHDPFSVTLFNRKSGARYSMKTDTLKAMWRNMGNLTAGSEHEGHIMPDTLRPVKKYENSTNKHIYSLGMEPKPQNAGYNAMLFDDTMLIPEEYFENQELGSYLTRRMNLIENISTCWDTLKISSILGTKDSGSGRYRDDALTRYWTELHKFLFSDRNGFLTQTVSLYEESSESFEQKADRILFDKLDDLIREICKLAESNANSWDMMLKIINCTKGKNGCLHKYNKIMKPYRNGEA